MGVTVPRAAQRADEWGSGSHPPVVWAGRVSAASTIKGDDS